ncbi:MAG: acyl--CoA ligase [bacterium]|nr:acyl--CoA ligase [bacterium]
MISKNCTLVHHFLEESAQKYPTKEAVIYEKTRTSFSEINSKANQLAEWLIKQGVSVGDRVAMIQENCPEYIITYYGALKAGAVIVSLSSDIKTDSLVPLLEELDAKVIISNKKFESMLREIDLPAYNVKGLLLRDPELDWSGTSLEVASWADTIQDKEASNPGLAMEQSDLAAIIYTSGSTGKPKGVTLSHGNILVNTDSICQYLELTENDIQMVVLPFFYVMGKSLLNTHFAVGGAVVLNNKFAFPATVIKQMVEEKVTGFSGVPSTFAYLLHRSPLAKNRENLTSLRYCSQAGGHMSGQIKEELMQILPSQTKIVIMYGATEASARLSYLDPDRLKDKMDSMGKAIPGVTLQILDPQGNPVARGETGEVVASGDNIMQGYWKDPEATAKVLDEKGWYHSGDMGYEDEEGFYFLVGRRDNLLKVGGHRINPEEVEDALMATELVLEAAVVGIPDELLGNRLEAVVVPIDKKSTDSDILGKCAEKLPKYKIPSGIAMVRSLPKKPNGKIDKGGCKKLLEAR